MNKRVILTFRNQPLMSILSNGKKEEEKEFFFINF